MKKKISEELKETIESPLSDDEIKKYLPNTPIIMYSELPKFNNIEDILKTDGDCCVLMYQDSENTGHWCGLLRQPKRIEFFDSYGIYPDKQLSWVHAGTRHNIGINGKYLSNLFNKTPLKIVYNTEPYQKQGNEIATCGRHVVFRLLHKNLPLTKYHNMIRKETKKQGIDYDALVAKKIDI